MPGIVEAASCRGYGQEVQAAIKRHVEIRELASQTGSTAAAAGWRASLR